MYSVVVMMALSGGADVPAIGRGGCFGGGGGCNGCYGDCGGRRGGGLFGGGGLFRGKRGGCDGGCYGGSACYGGYGGGGCYGGSACYGGGYGGCNGSGYGGCHGGAIHNGGCHGGYGGCHGGGMIRVIDDKKVMPPPDKKDDKKVTPNGTGAAPAPATIVVTLPAEAKLTFDGQATTQTTAERTFVSPALEAGREFTYTLEAKIVRDGKPQVLSRTIPVRAGEISRVNFDFPASVAVK